MAHVPGPWAAESRIAEELADGERGLAVIAVCRDVAPGATPTRGMVAWVHSGIGACTTDAEAIDTAALIAAAPDLAAALRECADDLEAEINGRNNNGNPHPAVAHQYEHDMASVRNARAALKAAGIA